MDRRHQRREDSRLSGDDVATAAFEGVGCLDEVFWAAVVVAVLAALFFVGIPLLLAVLDVLLILALTVVGVVARVLFRRPWTIEATCGERRVERQVVGWRASTDEMRSLADAIRHGTVA